MESVSSNLFVIGLLLLLGFIAHTLGKRTHVPRLTLLLLLGILSGPYVFNLFPETISKWFSLIAHMSLAMVGFLLGERFYGKDIKSTKLTIIKISIAQSLIVSILVFVLLFISGVDIIISLLLAGIAPATDPAATYDVIKEYKAKGSLSDVLLGIVSLDDAWGLIIFSIFLALAGGIQYGDFEVYELLLACWEILGSILLGIVLGLPMAMLTGRIRKGEPTLLEAAGFIFLCGGIALYLNLSYLLSCMVLGVVVANKAKHHTLPFRKIRGISDPFLALFFFLAGFSFKINIFLVVGLITFLYMIFRIIGKTVGGIIGGIIAETSENLNKRIGLCTIPQAGVALAMALVVVERFPEIGDQVLSIVIASTIIFEITGPLLLLWQLNKLKEIS